MAIKLIMAGRSSEANLLCVLKNALQWAGTESDAALSDLNILQNLQLESCFSLGKQRKRGTSLIAGITGHSVTHKEKKTTKKSYSNSVLCLFNCLGGPLHHQTFPAWGKSLTRSPFGCRSDKVVKTGMGKPLSLQCSHACYANGQTGGLKSESVDMQFYTTILSFYIFCSSIHLARPH